MAPVDKRDPAVQGERLTPEEDEILRRLHYFEQSGIALSVPMQRLKSELLSRDLRAAVREPVVEAVLSPPGEALNPLDHN